LKSRHDRVGRLNPGGQPMAQSGQLAAEFYHPDVEGLAQFFCWKYLFLAFNVSVGFL
jgi:hypothetical protein